MPPHTHTHIHERKRERAGEEPGNQQESRWKESYTPTWSPAQTSPDSSYWVPSRDCCNLACVDMKWKLTTASVSKAPVSKSLNSFFLAFIS